MIKDMEIKLCKTIIEKGYCTWKKILYWKLRCFQFLKVNFLNWLLQHNYRTSDTDVGKNSIYLGFNMVKLFILFMGFSRQEYWSGLPFPSPVDHILSELSPWPVHLGWPYMAHSFIELDKAVVHVIRLVSFLWLWFSVCLPSDGEG